MEEKIYYIYGHEHNGKWYVGQTVREPKDRWGRAGYHYLRKKDGYYVHPKFARAIKEFGWENFNHVILETTNNFTQLNDLELKWIIEKDSIDNGYNNDPRNLPKILDMRSTRKRMALASPSKKKVVMCDGNTGDPLLAFETLSFAAEFVGLKGYNSIGKCLSHDQTYGAGFRWRVFDEEKDSNIKFKTTENFKDYERFISEKYVRPDYHKPITVVSKENVDIYTFSNLKEVSEILGLKESTIKSRLSRGKKSKGIGECGFTFKYNKEKVGVLQNKKFNQDQLRDEILKFKIDNNYINGEAKRVLVFTDNNLNLRIFNSADEAGKFIGRYNGSWVADACRTGKKTFGFYWKYLEKDEEIENLNLSRDDLMKYCECKKVGKFDLTGNLLGTYKNITDAANSEGIKRKTVSNCCNNKQRTSGGFKWAFI